MIRVDKSQLNIFTTMSLAELFLLLPPWIDYAGFTFHLEFTEHREHGIGLAFVLSGCHSRKNYKRQAFKLGYWEDRAEHRQLSTMYSNYLFFEPLFDSSDTSLRDCLIALHHRLTEYRLVQPQNYRRALKTGHLICGPLKLME
jgi:hypothetical protein